jgi:hypothetical protein
MDDRFALVARLSSLALVGLVATVGSAAATPPSPVTRCEAQRLDYSGSEVANVSIEADPTSWGDGCVLSLIADPDTTITVKVRNVNHKLHPVSFDQQALAAEDAKVPSVLAQLLGLSTDSPTPKPPVAAPPNTQDPAAMVVAEAETRLREQLESLALFHEVLGKLKGPANWLAKIKAASERAESYADLKSEVLRNCKDASGVDASDSDRCLTRLAGLEAEAEGQLDVLENALGELESMARLEPDDSLLDYAVETVRAKYEVAKAYVAALPDLVVMAKGLLDQAATEAKLFSSAKSVRFEGGELVLTAAVKDSAAKDAATRFKLTVRVASPVKQRFAFSSGLVLSGLTDRNYVARTVDGTRSVARRGDEDDLRPAIGFLAHWRIGPRFAWSLGATGKDSELQYLTGPSWIFGSRQNFVVSLGVAVGSVKRLDGVEEGDILQADTVPTKDVVRAHAFAGISVKF